MKIMIVDDNKGMREVIKNMLQSRNIEFTECKDGSEAFKRYEEVQPDWVLMDLAMKNVDGISAIDEIRAKYPKARIIVLTDHSDAFFRKTAKQYGAVAYVLKENLHEVPIIIHSVLQ